MTRVVVALAGLLLLGGSARAQVGPEVLFPRDGARVAGSACWLVVRGGPAANVIVDGRPVSARRAERDVYHWRLEDVRREGSRVAWDIPGRDLALTVYGSSLAPERFHAAPPATCWECHREGEDGCGECHRWAETKHGPVLAEGCARCHEPPAWEAREVAPVCGACHPDYAQGNHPRLRHPVSAARDPLRPGRRMDCASCHDPHAPRCLGCLGRRELREWCKACHGRP